MQADGFCQLSILNPATVTRFLPNVVIVSFQLHLARVCLCEFVCSGSVVLTVCRILQHFFSPISGLFTVEDKRGIKILLNVTSKRKKRIGDQNASELQVI